MTLLHFVAYVSMGFVVAYAVFEGIFVIESFLRGE